MESLQAADDLNENVPDFLLLDVGLALLVVADFLEDITIVSILHDEAQAGCGFVDKSISVSNDIGMVNRRQNPYFVQGVFLLFL